MEYGNVTNSSAGYLKTNIQNNQLTTTNINFNIGEDITANYNSNLTQDLNNNTLIQNNPQYAYLSILQESHNHQTTFNQLTNTNKQWEEKTRYLNENGMAAVAIGAAAITIVTVGTASTISGAMLTAAASSAASTAATSATNTALNADGDIWKQLKDITTTAVKDTTDEESLKNMAIAAGVAGLSAWAVQATSGNPNLETGSYSDSKVGINVEPKNGTWYRSGTDIKANFFESHIAGTENPIFKVINSTIPSVKSGALGHDNWVDAMNFGGAMTAITAPPYILLNGCAAAPSLCATYTNYHSNDKFLRQTPIQN